MTVLINCSSGGSAPTHPVVNKETANHHPHCSGASAANSFLLFVFFFVFCFFFFFLLRVSSGFCRSSTVDNNLCPSRFHFHSSSGFLHAHIPGSFSQPLLPLLPSFLPSPLFFCGKTTPLRLLCLLAIGRTGTPHNESV